MYVVALSLSYANDTDETTPAKQMGGPKQKGITQYALSPMQSKPMAGAWKHWLLAGTRRLSQQAVYFAVPLAVGYGIIQWATKENHFRNSKGTSLRNLAHRSRD